MLLEENQSIREIIQNHTGKIVDKWDRYLDFYETEFSKYKGERLKLLELGVNLGGSLEIWAKYFTNAQEIFGIDTIQQVEEYEYEDKRIRTFCLDATQLKSSKLFSKYHPTIVIDDASHASRDVVKSFIDVFPMLDPGGLYVVEDLCCSYWEESNENENSSINFFKDLVDLINFEHWARLGNGRIMEKIRNKISLYSCDIDLKDFSSIVSIRFYNSMCFISKGFRESEIGKRVVRGMVNPLGNPKGRKSGTSPSEIVARKDGMSVSDLISKKERRK